MSALPKYLRLAEQIRGDDDPPDRILDAMDPLWWEMTEDERKVAEWAGQGKWVVVNDVRYCPFCGHSTVGSGAPVRCMACMRDVIPEVIS
jgi:hypothetical protein